MVVIAERLRILRETKKLSQGEIQNRAGLLRCYISRVENGHTIPSVETLEKLARALDLSLHEFLYDGEDPPADPSASVHEPQDCSWGERGKEGRFLGKLITYLSRMTEADRTLLLDFAEGIADRKKGRKASLTG